jgi:hypothetical protein
MKKGLDLTDRITEGIVTRNLPIMAAIAQSIARLAGRPALRLVLLGVGLILGACSKCDVPTWQHSSTGTTPAACHGGPQPQ